MHGDRTVSTKNLAHQAGVKRERSILALEKIYINGGRRGFLVCIAAADLQRALELSPVDVALA